MSRVNFILVLKLNCILQAQKLVGKLAISLYKVIKFDH